LYPGVFYIAYFCSRQQWQVLLCRNYLGMGNILRAAEIPYPTTTPPTTSNELPIVKIPQKYHGKMHLFILAGQSNMIG
jgi:hypothetical protein